MTKPALLFKLHGGGLLIRPTHALGIEAPDRSLAARRQHATLRRVVVAEVLDDVPASACTSVSLASTLSRESSALRGVALSSSAGAAFSSRLAANRHT
jgi:hypothetical protein